MIANWMLHRRTQRMLYEVATGISTNARCQQHAEECPVCSMMLVELRAVVRHTEGLKAAKDLGRPEGYWNTFADRVVRRIEQSERAEIVRPRLELRSAFLAGAVTAASIIFAALILWRSSDWMHTDSTRSGTAPVLSVRDRAYDYLERSRVVLVGVLNADTQALHRSPELLRRNGEASRSLVQEARGLSEELIDPADAQLRRLVNELEVILVQLANLEAGQDIPGLEIIRDGVDRRGVLLKITIEEMNRQRRPSKSMTPSADQVERSL